jgi:hypothetical protein
MLVKKAKLEEENRNRKGVKGSIDLRDRFFYF